MRSVGYGDLPEDNTKAVRACSSIERRETSSGPLMRSTNAAEIIFLPSEVHA